MWLEECWNPPWLFNSKQKERRKRLLSYPWFPQERGAGAGCTCVMPFLHLCSGVHTHTHHKHQVDWTDIQRLWYYSHSTQSLQWQYQMRLLSQPVPQSGHFQCCWQRERLQSGNTKRYGWLRTLCDQDTQRGPRTKETGLSKGQRKE